VGYSLFTDNGIARAKDAEAGCLTTTDPVIYEAAIRPWELLCSPIDPGNFRHYLVFLKTPRFVLYCETYELAVVLQGLSPPDMLALSVPLNIGPRAAYWQRSVGDQAMPSTMPGPLDVRLDTNHTHLMALVHLGFLQRHVAHDLLPALLGIGENRQSLVPRRVVNTIAAWMKRILAVAEQHPETLVAESTVNTIEQELLTLLMRTAEAFRPHFVRPSAPAKWRSLAKALEFLRYAEPARVTILELCQAAGVSERTLQYAFREVFDTTPLSFLRHRRFHAARRQLLASKDGAATVSQVAVAQGFYELGRFAVEYRRIFGELPSETLRRPPVESASSLRMQRPERATGGIKA